MLISRTSLITKSLRHHLRHYSASSAAAVIQGIDFCDHVFPTLAYLPGFPTPDPKYAVTIHALPRAASGTSVSENLRRIGRVPSIVFEAKDGHLGGNKRLISVETKQITNLIRALGAPFFLSRTFDLEVRPDSQSEDVLEKVRVLPRLLHQNDGTDAVLNVTFIRAPSSALLKVHVPLLFRGEDVSPGLKKGSYLNIIKRSVQYRCPADIIPPYIDVDLSEMDVGDKLEAGHLKVHPLLKCLVPADRPIVMIAGKRGLGDQKKAK